TILRTSCADAGIRVFGALANDPTLKLQERHLGLVQAGERADLEALLERAADCLGDNLDLAGLQEIAAAPSIMNAGPSTALRPLGQHIAIARDIAFGFCYPHMLDDWRGAGARISFFSPLADEAPAADADAVYLPGGYPELHAGRLSSNENFLHGLRDAAGRDAVILGECGGYMVLGRGVVDSDGKNHAMAGLLDLESTFALRKMHLGYRQATLQADCGLGAASGEFRAHEFHYANVIREQGAPLFTLRDALGEQLGQAGLVSGTIMGSFIHLIDRVG
ncbi:MAG: cobyrinate a,c-diamide synthase, partial [Rhodospirillales bacterium]|nr:cobyrinate a,c-diamide synthase [Rhodospirillales bacterium]